ncbi:hypothetical protein LXL04_007157 [Taraxacum kok-saghyz]
MHQNQTPKAPTNSNKYQIPIQKKAVAKTAQNLNITNRSKKVKSGKNNNRKTIAAAPIGRTQPKQSNTLNTFKKRHKTPPKKNSTKVRTLKNTQEQEKNTQEHSRTLKNMNNTQEQMKNTLAFRENFSN